MLRCGAAPGATSQPTIHTPEGGSVMSALPTLFPRVPLKKMDSSMLVFELDRETHRVMPEHCEMITSAATLASFLHREQTRFVRGDLPRVPYIEHPLRVALRLIRWGVRDGELVAAALLHDVVEDCSTELLEVFGSDSAGRSCETALECIHRLYGGAVAEYVGWVTNPVDGTSCASRTSYQDHITALAASGNMALLIKASDLKDNAGSIKYQLGHGKDERMLRLVTKYSPVVGIVAAGLEKLSADSCPHRLCLEPVIADMTQLAQSLETIAAKYRL